MGKILVLAEHRQGALRDISYEMMAVAPKLAEQMGGEVTVLLIGSGMDDLAAKMVAFGINVLVIDDPLFKDFNADKYHKVLSALIDDLKPDLGGYVPESTGILVDRQAKPVHVGPDHPSMMRIPGVGETNVRQRDKTADAPSF